MTSPRKIVVTTPTGHVGSRVVRLLLQAGTRPTLLLRDPAKLASDLRDRVDVVTGDQGDADVVAAATEDTDCLFWVDPPTPDDDPVAGYTRMGRSAAHAVTVNDIPRTVFLSSVGAEKRHGVGEIDGLAATEELLNATGSSVLHLRCGYFFTNLFMDVPSIRQGLIRTPWPLDFPLAWVDPRDIGDVVAARLLNADWSGQHTQAVHGPRDLTFAQVAGIVGEAIGRTVRAERIGDDELRASLRSAGLGERQVEGVVGMSAGQRDGFVPADRRDLVTTTPTPLSAWAHAWLRPAVR